MIHQQLMMEHVYIMVVQILQLLIMIHQQILMMVHV